MHSYQRITKAVLFASAAIIAACGGDEGGMMNPTMPVAGTGVIATAGMTGTAGRTTAGVAGMAAGTAGRVGAAGTGTAGRASGTAGTAVAAGSGASGTGAAGTGTAGTGTAGTGAAGTGTAGTGTAGTGTAGMMATAGMGASGTGSTMMGSGKCCPSGDCLCHGPDPMGLTSAKGSFKTATIRASTGTIHYPTDAEPPFAGVAVCGGFLNTGPEMDSWGGFYASHGIVTIITSTGASDQPDLRATKLIGAIKTLKDENMKSGSPLMGKMAGRYGTSGYSMGGGGTTIATGRDTTLNTSVGMAPWGGRGTGVKTPTLLFCGTSDTTAPCSMASSAYRGISGTPKMLVTLSGTSHLVWVGSYTSPGGGAAAKMALAFQKVFLEKDERWKPLLKMMTSGVSSIMSEGVN